MTHIIAATAVLCFSISIPAAARAPLPGSCVGSVQDEDPAETYKLKREEAGKDPGKLWEVHLWCEAYGLEREAKSCARAVVKYDDEHKEAHIYLGHVFYGGKWFTTERKMQRYKEEEEERIAKEKGLVKFRDEWVPEEDLPFLRKGLIKDDVGRWVNKEDREKTLAGWLRQDTEWVHPDDANKIEAGLWKCGEEWLEPEKANVFHAKLSSPWLIPDEVFLLQTTCDRETAEKALVEMHLAVREVKRVIGSAPTSKVNVALFRDAKQYGSFAAGNDVKGRPPVEISGRSSIHYAFMAEIWIDQTLGQHMGAGVGFWNPDDDSGGAFGPFSARHAAAIGILEQLDPSPKAMETVLKNPTNFNAQKFLDEHYDEKRLPAWFRDGVCSYAERWLLDSSSRNREDIERWRTWAATNILNKGGLRPIKKIFTDEVNVDKPDSAKLLSERGLLIAFLLDGDIEELKAKHFELKQKFKKGESLTSTLKSIEKLIIKHERELREFANL